MNVKCMNCNSEDVIQLDEETLLRVDDYNFLETKTISRDFGCKNCGNEFMKIEGVNHNKLNSELNRLKKEKEKLNEKIENKSTKLEKIISKIKENNNLGWKTQEFPLTLKELVDERIVIGYKIEKIKKLK